MKNDRNKNTFQLLARKSYIHPYIFLKYYIHNTVADLRGIRGVQLHPPLAGGVHYFQALLIAPGCALFLSPVPMPLASRDYATRTRS